MKNKFILAIIFGFLVLGQSFGLTAAAADRAPVTHATDIKPFVVVGNVETTLANLNELATLLSFQRDVFEQANVEHKANLECICANRRFAMLMGGSDDGFVDGPERRFKSLRIESAMAVCVAFRYEHLFKVAEIEEFYRPMIVELCRSSDFGLKVLGDHLMVKLEVTRTSIARKRAYERANDFFCKIIQKLDIYYQVRSRRGAQPFEALNGIKFKMKEAILERVYFMLNLIELYNRYSYQNNEKAKAGTFTDAYTSDDVAFDAAKEAWLRKYSEVREELESMLAELTRKIDKILTELKEKRVRLIPLLKYGKRFGTGESLLLKADDCVKAEVAADVDSSSLRGKRRELESVASPVKRKRKKTSPKRGGRRRNKKRNGAFKDAVSAVEEGFSRLSHTVCLEGLLDPVDTVATVRALELDDILDAAGGSSVAADDCCCADAAVAPMAAAAGSCPAEEFGVPMQHRGVHFSCAKRVKRWFNVGVDSGSAPFRGYVPKYWDDEIFRHGISKAIDMFVHELAIEGVQVRPGGIEDKTFTVPLEIIYRTEGPEDNVRCFTITYVQSGVDGKIYHRRIDEGPFTRRDLVENYLNGELGHIRIEDLPDEEESSDSEDDGAFRIATSPKVRDDVYDTEYYYKIIPRDIRFAHVQEIRLYKYRDASCAPAASVATAACAAAAEA